MIICPALGLARNLLQALQAKPEASNDRCPPDVLPEKVVSMLATPNSKYEETHGTHQPGASGFWYAPGSQIVAERLRGLVRELWFSALTATARDADSRYTADGRQGGQMRHATQERRECSGAPARCLQPKQRSSKVIGWDKFPLHLMQVGKAAKVMRARDDARSTLRAIPGSIRSALAASKS